MGEIMTTVQIILLYNNIIYAYTDLKFWNGS